MIFDTDIKMNHYRRRFMKTVEKAFPEMIIEHKPYACREGCFSFILYGVGDCKVVRFKEDRYTKEYSYEIINIKNMENIKYNGKVLSPNLSDLIRKLRREYVNF